MGHFSLLQDLTLIFILSSAVIFIFNKLRIPSILGFIISGILAGPYGFRLIQEVEDVNIISEIGIILLLFTIGLEFSLQRLNKLKNIFLYGGTLQVFGTILLTYLICFFILDFSTKLSLIISFIIALSSTAIVLKIFQEHGETQTPHGNISVGILIYQDIIVVIMLLLVPYMSNNIQADYLGIVFALLKSAVIISFFYVVAIKIVPKLLYEVLRLQNNELFLIFTLSLCFIIAFIAERAGLSLAFGAFLAGLIISESDYSHHVFENILPFKEVFSSFFFISIGMLLNVGFFIDFPFTIIAAVLGIMFFKFIIIVVSVKFLRVPTKTAIMAGLALLQIGEFSFLLTKLSYENNILTTSLFQFIISSTILSMVLSIFILKNMHTIADVFGRLFNLGETETPEEKTKKQLRNHVVIIGFGISGKNLVKGCKTFNIPYVIVEFNPKTVRYYSVGDENIFFGDATQAHVLREAGIDEAKMISIAISDPVATRRIVYKIREMSSSVEVIVRTRFYQEINELKKLGADHVVSEEYEASIRILSIALNKYLIPDEDIVKFEKLLRQKNYEAMDEHFDTETFQELLSEIPDYEIQTLSMKNLPKLVDKKIEDLDLTNTYNILILAVKREDKLLANPSPEIMLTKEDNIVVFGRSDGIQKLFKYNKEKKAFKI